MGQPEGTDIPRFFIVTQQIKNDRTRNILKMEGEREIKH
jgi:hypothetical protein